MMTLRFRPLVYLALLGSAPCFAQSSVQQDALKSDFFETRVRPVFVKNCQMCHNAKTKTAALDLSSASGFVAGGQSGPLISKNDLAASRLLRAIGYDDSLKMPPMGKLKVEEIENIAAWVKLGAPWPGADQAAAPAQTVNPPHEFSADQKKFWAFQPVTHVTPPATVDLKWVHNEIDRFISAKLKEKGLKPSPRADKTTLLRRATFDLTGLPPTLEEIERFQADNSPAAFEKVVDRLLASPHYGERWGRHWLDIARYADSTGNDEDHRYPYAWRYRDYVIDAFNRDVPYDQFVREQLAGDLMKNTRGIVATGFLALGAKALAQQDKQKMMYDIYDEQVDVTSRAFIGLTMACARCHNHKFDPILTKDYYSFVSIFASTKQFADEGSHVSKLLFTPLVPAEVYASYKTQQDRLSAIKVSMDEVAGLDGEKYTREQGTHLAEYMIAARRVYDGKEAVDQVVQATGLDKDILARWVKYLQEGMKAHPQLADWDNASPENQPGVAQIYQARFAKQFDDWTAKMDKWRAQVRKRIQEMDMPPPPKPKFEAATDLFFYEIYIQKGPFELNDKDREKVLSPEVKEKLEALRKEEADLKAHAMPEPDMACAVAEGKRVEQKVFIRGDYNSPGEDAPKAFPAILAKPSDPAFASGSGRLELANWIAQPDNPLTARVIVNRIWGWHFGEGLVRTPDNFGRMGDRPSHPELLDYLAERFVQSGWSIKALNRMIMLSSAYQTSSDADEKTLEADQENRWLAHFNRQRLEVEEIRDALLSLDGSLDFTMGGTLQSGFGTDGENSASRLSLDPLKITRRTVYLPLRRANLPTLLNLFDFGDASTVNGRRTLTNVAPQTLFMMNSDFGFDHAKKIAESLAAMQDASDSKRLEQGYLRILNRKPDAREIDSALTYISQYARKYPDLDAWQSFCHILMSSNEFVYLD